jgi:hypothetical protein
MNFALDKNLEKLGKDGEKQRKPGANAKNVADN